MKEIILALSFSLITLIAHSQNDNFITFGILGGANFAALEIQSPYKQYLNKSPVTPGSLGLDADFKMSDYFSIRPGILYTGKGGEVNPFYVDANGNDVGADDIYNLYYLEIPVNFIGHFPLGDSGANLFLGAGPYFAYGLSGSNQQTLGSDNEVKKDVKFGSNGDFKSTDLGASTVVGFQAGRGWSISFNLDLGLTNILQNNNSGFDASSFKTLTFYFGVGQTF